MTTRLAGLLLGLLASGVLPVLPGPVATVCLALAGLPLLWGGLWRPPGVGHGAGLVGGLCLGLALGSLHGHQLAARRLPEPCVRQELALSGRIVSLVQVSTLGAQARQQRFLLQVSGIRPRACAGPYQVLLAYYGPQAVRPGEHWQFQARLKRPWGQVNPAGFNVQAWFAQAAIDATGSAGREARRLAPAGALDAPHHRLRARISAAQAQLPLAAQTRAVLQAVTVADRGGLDPGLWRLFQAYGINHLLVISGLHIGLVAAAAYGLGRLAAGGLLLAGATRPARLLPGLLALLMATSYSALAGFSLPALRALAMLACAVLAAACWRRAGAWRNLLLAAVALLLANPLAALGSGFWLSFGAVACLLWLAVWAGGGDRVSGRIRGRLAAALATHAYMSLAMLPLGAWWFGGFSQVAALANLLLVPLLGFYVVPLALAGALCHGPLPGVASALWRWAGAPLEWWLPLAADWLRRHPDGFYRGASASPLEALLALLAVVLVVLPGQWRLRALLPVLLLPLLSAPLAPRTAAVDAVHVLVLDVGQGTAVLIYNRERALLYDTGGAGAGGSVAQRVVLPLLQARGIARLDTLVVSHGDQDHSGGLADILGGVPVGRLLTGPDVASAAGRPCRAGQHWQWPGGAVRFTVLSPAREPRLSRNRGSCVLRVAIGGRSLLLPGDIDAGRERELVTYWRGALASDWLLAAHHGSASSTSHAWLKTVQPRHVVFSHGYANRFGHPHPAVRQRVREHGARAWSTAEQGALELVFRADGSLRVIAHRSLRRRHWL